MGIAAAAEEHQEQPAAKEEEPTEQPCLRPEAALRASAPREALLYVAAELTLVNRADSSFGARRRRRRAAAGLAEELLEEGPRNPHGRAVGGLPPVKR